MEETVLKVTKIELQAIAGALNNVQIMGKDAKTIAHLQSKLEAAFEKVVAQEAQKQADLELLQAQIQGK